MQCSNESMLSACMSFDCGSDIINYMSRCNLCVVSLLRVPSAACMCGMSKVLPQHLGLLHRTCWIDCFYVVCHIPRMVSMWHVFKWVCWQSNFILGPMAWTLERHCQCSWLP